MSNREVIAPAITDCDPQCKLKEIVGTLLEARLRDYVQCNSIHENRSIEQRYAGLDTLVEAGIHCGNACAIERLGQQTTDQGMNLGPLVTNAITFRIE